MTNTPLANNVIHIGAANGKGLSPINPSSRMDNCSACTSAYIINKTKRLTGEDIITADHVERSSGYSGRQRNLTCKEALKYIERATRTTSEVAAFMDDTAEPGNYAVFPRVRDESYTHVMYGEVRSDATRYLYDPQIDVTMSWDEMRQRYTGGARTFLMRPNE